MIVNQKIESTHKEKFDSVHSMCNFISNLLQSIYWETEFDIYLPNYKVNNCSLSVDYFNITKEERYFTLKMCSQGGDIAQKFNHIDEIENHFNKCLNCFDISLDLDNYQIQIVFKTIENKNYE